MTLKRGVQVPLFLFYLLFPVFLQIYYRITEKVEYKNKIYIKYDFQFLVLSIATFEEKLEKLVIMINN